MSKKKNGNENENKNEEVDKEVEFKYSFWKIFTISVFKFDEYASIANQKVKRMILYLVELIAIFAVIVACGATYQVNQTCTKLNEKCKEELPEFTIEDGVFQMSSGDTFTFEPEVSATVKVCFTNETDTQQYEDEASTYAGMYFAFTHSKLITNVNSGAVMTVDYSQIKALQGKKVSKEDVINLLAGKTSPNMYVIVYGYMFIGVFAGYLLSMLINCLALAILLYIFTKLVRVPLKFGQVFNIAIAAHTLSLVIAAVYSLFNFMCAFVIQNFDILFTIISYIYAFAAVIILKTNMEKTKSAKVKISKLAKEGASNDVDIDMDLNDIEEPNESDNEDSAESDSKASSTDEGENKK